MTPRRDPLPVTPDWLIAIQAILLGMVIGGFALLFK